MPPKPTEANMSEQAHEPCQQICEVVSAMSAWKLLFSLAGLVLTLFLITSSLAWATANKNGFRLGDLEKRAAVTDERNEQVRRDLAEIKVLLKDQGEKIDEMRRTPALPK